MEYREEIKKLKKALDSAEAVFIGAGAGLSASAGLTYSGERFYKYFGDMAERFAISDMYSAGFYPFPNEGSFWAFWSRNIYYNRFADDTNDCYALLLSLVKDKNYFVITTNVDHCFQRAGFDKRRLWYMQGDYGLFQCSLPCTQDTYDNEDTIRAMIASEEDMKVPPELFPRCPKCGRRMTLNLRIDDSFVQDKGWYEARERYEAFIRDCKRKRVLFLELGVGMNTPVWIKYPFIDEVCENRNAVYASINRGDAFAPGEISERSILIDADIRKTLAELLEIKEK
ncbi:MAG: Sir2 silent information regulator family NAD-dependent deacetylase [Oscillospiraceae bacterium]|nr:Sir2 silent information regulator family NAD-dependent deacetylase [Oscillospiraceae bacterium]